MKWYYLVLIIVAALVVGYLVGRATAGTKELADGTNCKKADGADGTIKDGKCS